MSQTDLARLSREDRLRLLRFVASFAWADLTIRDEERAFEREYPEAPRTAHALSFGAGTAG